MKQHSVALLIVLTGLAIEAMLLVRIWAQATAQPVQDGLMEGLFSLTDDLASVFTPLTGEAPLHETGVIDYAVLLAAEVYFVATLALLGLTLAAIKGWALFGRLRRRSLPPFVQAEIAYVRPRRHWQPMRSARIIGVRYYAPLRRRAEPEHAKAGLGQ